MLSLATAPVLLILMTAFPVHACQYCSLSIAIMIAGAAAFAALTFVNSVLLVSGP